MIDRNRLAQGGFRGRIMFGDKRTETFELMGQRREPSRGPWKPITTAPSDRHLLVRDADGNHYEAICIDNEWWANTPGDDQVACEPTHWVEIPG